jgi:uncharacterized protein (DUF885 family)
MLSLRQVFLGLCLVSGAFVVDGLSSFATAGASAGPPSAALHQTFDQMARERLSLSPQAMSAALLGTTLEAEYLGRLDVSSVAATEAALAMARRHRRMLDAFDRAALTEADRLSYDIMVWQLDQQIAGASFLWHDFPVNQLMAIHNMLPGFMTDQHPLRRDADIDFYLDRLAQFPAAFEGAAAVLEHRAGQGLMPPRFALEKTLRDSRAFIAGDPAANPLVTEIVARADRSGVLSEARRSGLEAALITAIERHVIPAYQTLIDALEDGLEQARSNDGVWRLPDGEAYYRWLLREHTTTELSPAEIHHLGLREVERIEADMHAILCGQNYCEGTVGERMVALNTEARFLFDDSPAGRQAILDTYRKIVAEAVLEMNSWFHDGPSYALEVRRVPKYREAAAFGAYYMRGVPDGSRPGVFYVNLRSVAEHPRYALRTLAYHEAVPGHHLQISRMQVMADVPDFRRSVRLHAHAEGWALYAERLAWEMGLHQDPFDNLGRLQAELFRAVRLVVDTGMHYKRWSREQGIEYMHAVTGMPMSDVVAEIERYLVIPGQACSFKVGMLRIQAMRQRAEQRLGDRFDVRDFHRLVLDSGAMPLELLDRVVDDWVATAGRESL